MNASFIFDRPAWEYGFRNKLSFWGVLFFSMMYNENKSIFKMDMYKADTVLSKQEE